MTTNDLRHALAFARSDVHSGDEREMFNQAKAACRTLADEVERLQRQLAAIRTEVIDRHEVELRQRERYKQSFLDMFNEANP
jgi:hypothetical protein